MKAAAVCSHRRTQRSPAGQGEVAAIPTVAATTIALLFTGDGGRHTLPTASVGVERGRGDTHCRFIRRRGVRFLVFFSLPFSQQRSSGPDAGPCGRP
ncbi:hypothetical protein NDU88_000140 [Pleurodeles waltl]|uniref:Uncharacterized protein n=1 Tax=Pleurodeles waltl TaxID=8319 RepID=A0AAV7UQF9_PLEWA|nr:hypothetical protein NDU88_000140 [Pleurodeles waltl]